MGNEFGHPEWIDFPREGNNWSYHYCRRRWDLADRTDLRYNHLLQFEKRMIELDTKYNVISEKYQYVRTQHDKDQILVYEKASLVFIFNFSPTQSYENYPIYIRNCKSVKYVLSTE
jgi:1,4-alpha-glucan branching enzyme